jgi:hypothetical protein
MQCTAYRRGGKEPCKAFAMHGRNVCRLHGGKSLAGNASATFKTGRYSKHLPEHLRARYQTALGDADLLVMRDEVSLTDARLTDLITRLNDQDNAARWYSVRAAFREYTQALAHDGEEDAADPAMLLTRLEGAIFAGSDDDRVWDGIADVIEQRRKLVESERKRLVDLQQMLTAEQAMVLLSQVADTVRRHVTDRTALAGISADLVRLMAHGPGGEARSA